MVDRAGGKPGRLRRAAALALATLALAGPVRSEEARDVVIPDGDVALKAGFHPASGGVPVVALHGCGGPWRARDRQWARLLGEAGHAVLLPDSFGSRGLGSQCTVTDRTIRPGRERRRDAVASVDWLRRETGAESLVVMGWSNGGSTVLAAAREGVMPPGSVRGYVAFYPGCGVYARDTRWAPAAPILILMGADDDWTPAAPCRVLAERFPDRITLVTYPDTYHDFDVPGRPVRERTGLAYTAGGAGTAHTGSNAPARADAIARVLAFIRGARG